MTRIGKTYILCNILNFHARVCEKEFFRFVDPVNGKVFISRTSKKSLEQPGQILRGDVNPAAELLHGEFSGIVCFNILYCRGDIPLI